jgi:hypothetical protein
VHLAIGATVSAWTNMVACMSVPMCHSEATVWTWFSRHFDIGFVCIEVCILLYFASSFILLTGDAFVPFNSLIRSRFRATYTMKDVTEVQKKEM